MQVHDLMTRKVYAVAPETKLIEIAKKMRSLDIGAVVVVRSEKPVGVITDRDIVVRAVARRKTRMTAEDIMTSPLVSCYEDQSVSEVVRLMQAKEVRRLAVMNRDGDLTGLLSIGDIVRRTGDDEMGGQLLAAMSRPDQEEADFFGGFHMSRGTTSTRRSRKSRALPAAA